jgi:hypothetical protein
MKPEELRAGNLIQFGDKKNDCFLIVEIKGRRLTLRSTKRRTPALPLWRIATYEIPKTAKIRRVA